MNLIHNGFCFYVHRIFTYDCEIGTWVAYDGTRMTHATSGNTYEIDLCMSINDIDGGMKNLCGSYLFRMPSLQDIDPDNEWDDLVLLEKEPLFNDHTITLYFPPQYQGPRNIALLRGKGNKKGEAEKEVDEKRYLIKQFESTENTSRAVFDVGDYIEAGIEYEIVLMDRKEDGFVEGAEWFYNTHRSVVASFSIDINDPEKRGTTAAIVLLLLLLVTAVLVVLGYLQYLRVKKQNKVDPKR